MSITYPLSVPTSPVANSVKIIASNNVGVVSSPFTGQTQVIEWPYESFTLQLTLPPMKRDNAETWIAFLLALRGQSGTFLYGDPSYTGARGVATGTPLVNGANAAGSKTLATKGWTHSVTGILKAGDLLQVGTGATTRLHKVLTDANSDSSGNAPLDIFPRLRESLSDGASIVLSSPKGTFRLNSNQREWDVSIARIYGISFQAQEAI